MAEETGDETKPNPSAPDSTEKPKIRSLLEIDPWRDVPAASPEGSQRKKLRLDNQNEHLVTEKQHTSTCSDPDVPLNNAKEKDSKAFEKPVKAIPSLLEIDPFQVPVFANAEQCSTEKNACDPDPSSAHKSKEVKIEKNSDSNAENLEISSIKKNNIPSLLDIDPFGGRPWPVAHCSRPSSMYMHTPMNKGNNSLPMRQIQPQAMSGGSAVAPGDIKDVEKEKKISEMTATLFEYIQDNSIDKIKELFAQGMNANVVFSDGSVPLLCAVRSGEEELVELILSHGGNVNQQDATGATALHIAAKTPVEQLKLNIAEMLVAHNASTEIVDFEGCCPLHLACKAENKDLIRILLPKSDVNRTSNDGSSCLHIAAKLRSAEIAQMLVNEGADPNLQDSAYETPLIIAARSGDSSVVEILLSAQCEVNTKGFMEYTALHWAVHGGFDDVIKQLLQAGVNLNVQSALGRSPLHRAVAAGHVAITEQLLLAGSNTELVDGNGETPLVTATRFGFIEIVRLLLKYNANPDPFGLSSKTPLMKAILSGFKEIAELLVKVDCDLSLLQLASSKLLCGGRLGWLETKENIQVFISEHANLMQPRKLEQLCRSSIRHQLRMGGHSVGKIKDLPLPEAIVSFICLEEELASTNSGVSNSENPVPTVSEINP